MSMNKRVAASVWGATLGAALGVIAAVVAAFAVGWVWGPLYASEEDMARNVKLVLAAVGAAAAAGGWGGVRWARART